MYFSMNALRLPSGIRAFLHFSYFAGCMRCQRRNGLNVLAQHSILNLVIGKHRILFSHADNQLALPWRLSSWMQVGRKVKISTKNTGVPFTSVALIATVMLDITYFRMFTWAPHIWIGFRNILSVANVNQADKRSSVHQLHGFWWFWQERVSHL